MPISVLGIAGSPRRGGNTETLLDHALAGAKGAGAVTEKVALRELHLSGCICPKLEDCLQEGVCSVQDDMQMLYTKLLECDLLVIASPIFFRSVPAQLKAMIDRCQAIWVRKYKLSQNVTPTRTTPRRTLFISVANQNGRREFEGAIIMLRTLFATLNARYEAELLVEGLERPRDIHARPDYLEKACDLGARLAREESAKQTGGDA